MGGELNYFVCNDVCRHVMLIARDINRLIIKFQITININNINDTI